MTLPRPTASATAAVLREQQHPRVVVERRDGGERGRVAALRGVVRGRAAAVVVEGPVERDARGRVVAAEVAVLRRERVGA